MNSNAGIGNDINQTMNLGKAIGIDLTQTKNFEAIRMQGNIATMPIGFDESSKVFYKTSGLGLKNSLSSSNRTKSFGSRLLN